jgi:Domain of unknown function (DUF5667)
MTRAEKDLDEFGKRLLAPLRETPTPDPHVLGQEKARFLELGVSMQQIFIPQPSTSETARRQRPHMIFKAITAALIALFILVGSSLTVYAAQDSLPGETLYLVKSWSEDIRLSLTSSPQAKLRMTLDYTNRRVGEIKILLAMGKSLPERTSDRFQAELDNVLQLAVQMDDSQMHYALGQIKQQAESQGMTMEELLNSLPEQSEPAIIRLRQRLLEQVTLSAIGENDPQAFRSEIHKRQQNQPGSHKPAEDDADTTPEENSGTLHPTQDSINPGTSQPSEHPGNNGNGGGQGKPNPGNGNHGSGPSGTSEP